MQVCEFKAWFEGFTEDMTKLPTVKQWLRIKARIDEIDGVATTERYFRDYYWRPHAPYWPSIGTTSTNVPCGTLSVSNNSGQADGTETVLNVNQAFTALGKAEAASVAA